MSTEMFNPVPDVLKSWKEIARYLDRGIRTVQRWHVELGLPVHRREGQGRNAVFARRSDLEEWIRSCPTERGRGIFADRGFTDKTALNGPPARRTNEDKPGSAVSRTASLVQNARLLRRHTRETSEKIRHTIAQLHRTVGGMVISGPQRDGDSEQLTIRIPVVLSEPSAPEEVGPNTEILNSWKEIASYLGRGIRTVQRWETDFGLPARRPHGYSRSAVFAIRAELDKWFRSDRARNLRKDGADNASASALDRQKEAWLQQQIFVETLQFTRRAREQLDAAICEFQQTLRKLAPPGEFLERLAIRQILPPV